MGAISALIVGPCVAAPLAGALVYISQTRDVVIGGAALFALAVGMSMPLLLVGVSAGSLLPRAGAWMERSRVLRRADAGDGDLAGLAGAAAGGADAGLGRAAARLRRLPAARRAQLGRACALGALFARAGRARSWPAWPAAGAIRWRRWRICGRRAQQAWLSRASRPWPSSTPRWPRTGGKTVMLDFYADWCVSCKEMEKLTFVDPGVQAQLAETLLLQVDVTANDADDKAMLKRFGLFGPPGHHLFDANGSEIPDSRVIGYQDAGKFRASLEG